MNRPSTKPLAFLLALLLTRLIPARATAQISSRFTPQAVLATMETVADWQLAQPGIHRPRDWTYGALYAGVMALSDVANDWKYHDAMVEMGELQRWEPGAAVYSADDQCVAQTYLELYLQHRDPAMLAPIRRECDFILAHPDTNSLLVVGNQLNRRRWSWCDSLFMAPPVWVRLYNATGDRRYLDFMDREWRATSALLYDPVEHLYFRDSRYITRREPNGKKVFWSRGDGWVIAGLARVLENLPPDSPDRGFYERQFREMAAAVAKAQQRDGLWRSSLLDPKAFPLKETSGSGFFTFALAWGVNRGLLPRAEYEPVVRRAWRALVACVRPDGKLEYVQPIGGDPRKFDPKHSDVFGVGAFLLAGSELYRLALSEARAAAYGAFLPGRGDEFAWENERIGFRVRGPASEREGETGSGIGILVKRTRRPVIDRWACQPQNADTNAAFDLFKVGSSRGCGGNGIWRGGRLYAAKNFLTWHILECGPERVVFELTYAPFDAGGTAVRETQRISLQTGSNLNRIETRFDWAAGGPSELTMAVGLLRRAGGGSLEVADDASWMTYWDPDRPPGEIVGTGVVMSSPGKFTDAGTQALLRVPVKRGQPVVYYAGAGWGGERAFRKEEFWVKYILDFSRKLKR